MANVLRLVIPIMALLLTSLNVLHVHHGILAFSLQYVSTGNCMAAMVY